jgi:hypothetical protein
MKKFIIIILLSLFFTPASAEIEYYQAGSSSAIMSKFKNVGAFDEVSLRKGSDGSISLWVELGDFANPGVSTDDIEIYIDGVPYLVASELTANKIYPNYPYGIYTLKETYAMDIDILPGIILNTAGPMHLKVMGKYGYLVCIYKIFFG